MLKFQNFADANGNRIRKNLIRAGMLVLSGPNAVFILWNSSDDLGLNASVAAASRASPGSVVLADDGVGTARVHGNSDEKPSEADCCSLSRRLHAWRPSIVESIRLYPLTALKSMKSVVLRGVGREPCAISFKRFFPHYDFEQGENSACLKNYARFSTSMDTCRWSNFSCSRGKFSFR